MQIAKRNYSKKKAAKYYLLDKKAILKKPKKKYKNLSDVEKQAKKEYQKSYHKKLMAYQDELLLEELKRDKKNWPINTRNKEISAKTCQKFTNNLNGHNCIFA